MGTPLSIELTQKAPIAVSGVMIHHCAQLKPWSRWRAAQASCG